MDRRSSTPTSSNGPPVRSWNISRPDRVSGQVRVFDVSHGRSGGVFSWGGTCRRCLASAITRVATANTKRLSVATGSQLCGGGSTALQPMRPTNSKTCVSHRLFNARLRAARSTCCEFSIPPLYPGRMWAGNGSSIGCRVTPHAGTTQSALRRRRCAPASLRVGTFPIVRAAARGPVARA